MIYYTAYAEAPDGELLVFRFDDHSRPIIWSLGFDGTSLAVRQQGTHYKGHVFPVLPYTITKEDIEKYLILV
jgi:hypothetical protein